MFDTHSNGGVCSNTRRIFHRLRRFAAAVAAGLLLCLLALPACADDEAPTPPTAQDQASSALWTISIVSLVAGFGVYYLIQRHRVMHEKEHTPEWDKRMGISAIAFAILSTVIIWAVLAAFSRPAPSARHASITAHHSAFLPSFLSGRTIV